MADPLDLPPMSSLPATLPAPPLSEDKLGLLARLTEGLDAPGLWWLSGYAAGLADRPAARAPTPSARLSIVYGSQTGNARRLAEALARQAEAAGLGVRPLRADAYPLRELPDERLLYVVISTQGDGDPPDDARGLVSHLLGRRAPALKQLKFAVLGLGDSSYPKFCSVGRELDERLAELGAQRLFDRGDADLDIDTVATPWLARALDQAQLQLKAAPVATVTPLRPVTAPVAPWSRDRPWQAELLVNQRLTGRGSRKDVRHLELSLEGSGLAYQPGDALGVWPRQSPEQVAGVLEPLALAGEEIVASGGESLPLQAWLSDRRELTRLSRGFLQAHAERAGSGDLHRLLQPAQASELAHWLATHQLPDLLQSHPAAWSATDLVAALRPLAPRLYSIASAQSAVGAEAHLTVDHPTWQAGDTRRHGVASHFLATQAEGARLPVFIEANDRFRLPRDGQRDIVMIGPGTGVAPFRGFLQERVASGAGGRNWLLFGNPHARNDFLYQLEWQQALRSGQLARLDLAFSRDPPPLDARETGKVYVQHRLLEQGRDLFAWLQEGAHLYVCGDAARMARDVEAALLAVIARHGGLDDDGARDYLDALQQQGRYARDVY